MHPSAVRLAASLQFWHPEAELRVYHDGMQLRPRDARILARLSRILVVPLDDVWVTLVEGEGPLTGGAARPREEVRTGRPWSSTTSLGAWWNQASDLPSFGLSRPLDVGEPDFVTHPIVHRTHLEVFGHLFPMLAPPEGFAWLSYVYGPRFTFIY